MMDDGYSLRHVAQQTRMEDMNPGKHARLRRLRHPPGHAR